MKPKKLTIEGFLSYNHPETLDFASFDLACITGENGAGKSSILDAMTWALFGKSRSRGESVINLQSDEAFVSFEFEYSGEDYVIERRNPRGGTQSLELKTKDIDLSERTLRDTQSKLERILSIDYDTFINAVFFLQGQSDQFVTATPGQRKQVLFEILNLDAWEIYRKNATKKIKEIDNTLMRLEGKEEELLAAVSGKDTIEDELTKKKKDLEYSKDQTASMKEALAEKKYLLEQRATQATAVKEAQAALNVVDQTINDLTENLRKYAARKKEYEQVLNQEDKIESDYKRQKEAQEILAQIETAKQEYQALSSEVKNLQERRKEFNEQREKLPALEEKLAQKKELLSEKEGIENKLQDLTSKQAELEAKAGTLDREIGKKQDRLEKLKKGLEGVCPTCGQDISDPAKTIESLREEIGELQIDFEDAIEKKADLKPGIYGLQKEIRDLDSVQSEVGKLSGQIESIKELSFDEEHFVETTNKLKEIPYSEEKEQDIRQEIKDLEDAPVQMGRLDEAKKGYDDILRIIESEEKSLDYNREDAIEKQNKLNELKKEGEGLPSIDELNTKIKKLEEEIRSNENTIARINRDIGSLQKELKTISDSREKLEEIKSEQKSKTEHRQKLIVLREAFSKEGVPALLVEQSLPQIEDKANQLLSKLSNGSMQVHFVTQKEYADSSRDDMKETLEIEIQDQSGIRDYEMYSGGESFRINFAVRIALSHILANRAGAKLRTLVIDEGFGSQDASGRERLIEAIDAVREEYNTVLVITHIPEIMERFPTQIRVEKTAQGSKIEVM